MNSATKIAVIDTGICNLRSVTKALEAVGASIRVVQTPAEVAAAKPAGSSCRAWERCGTAWRRCASAKLDARCGNGSRRTGRSRRVPGDAGAVRESEEGGVIGLGVFPGKVVRFQLPREFKIPHMGWNTVQFRSAEVAATRSSLTGRRSVLFRAQLSLRAGRSVAGARRSAITAGLSARRSGAAAVSRRSFTRKRARRRGCRSTEFRGGCGG